VGGTLLLVAFLMPSAITSCAQQSAISGAPWATYGDGKELSGKDLDQARKELAIVELLRGMNLQNDPIGAVDAHEDPAHWWMLSEEAKLAGLVGGAGEGEATLAAIAAASNAAGANITTDTVVRNLMRASGANRDFVLDTTAKWRGAARLVTLCQSVDRISDKRLEQFVARGVLGMSGDIVVLDARTNATIPTGLPAEAALEAKLEAKLDEQLKKYADKPAPAESGKDNFGYRLPDRVKLEWLTISKSAVEATVQNSPELQSLALKKRFAQDPAKYGADPALSPSFSAYEATVRSRTVEDLKARFYAARTRLALHRGAPARTIDVTYRFDAGHERARKAQAERLSARTPADLHEEEYLRQELRRLDDGHRRRRALRCDGLVLCLFAEAKQHHQWRLGWPTA
jgi:hypothetical protein